MKAETPNEKPKAPRKRAKPSEVDIDKLVEEKVADIMAKQPAPTVIAYTPVHTAEVQPAQEHIEPEHHSPIEQVEEKVVSTWKIAKAWKYFWFAVAGLGIILAIFIWQKIRSGNQKKDAASIEKTKTEIGVITVKEDTTLLQQRFLQWEKLRKIDSLTFSLQQTQRLYNEVMGFEKKNSR